MSDYDLPSVYSQTLIKSSRKPHKCCECHRQIPSKSSYQLVKGCWDGKWLEYKTCNKCLVQGVDYYLETKEHAPFGYLKEYCAEDGVTFWRTYQ